MPWAMARTSSIVSSTSAPSSSSSAAVSRRLVLEALALERELDAQRDEPLLGSVVHVALDAAPRLVGHGDDPRA